MHVCVVTVQGEDPEFVRAKYFFRDEFLVRLMFHIYLHYYNGCTFVVG